MWKSLPCSNVWTYCNVRQAKSLKCGNMQIILNSLLCTFILIVHLIKYYFAEEKIYYKLFLERVLTSDI